MKILVADCCAEVCNAYRTFLHEEIPSATILEVQDGAHLLARASGEHLDLVLVQWELAGGMAGRLLSALHAAALHVPILVISARSECREPALAAGADAFLVKTAAPEQLRAAVHALIGEKWLVASARGPELMQKPKEGKSPPR